MKRFFRTGLALLAVVMLCMGASCPEWLGGSPTDPGDGSPPKEFKVHNTGALVQCIDGTEVVGVDVTIDNAHASITEVTQAEGSAKGKTIPRPLKYETTLFSTDPPWKLGWKVEEKKDCQPCNVSPCPPNPCIGVQRDREFVDWRDWEGLALYLRMDITIDCG